MENCFLYVSMVTRRYLAASFNLTSKKNASCEGKIANNFLVYEYRNDNAFSASSGPSSSPNRYNVNCEKTAFRIVLFDSLSYHYLVIYCFISAFPLCSGRRQPAILCNLATLAKYHLGNKFLIFVLFVD